jgi:hypothetical protein
MIHFALAIPFRVINPIIDDPELIVVWVDVAPRHHAYPFDNAMSLSTVLPSQQFDFEGGVMIHQVSLKMNYPLSLSFPYLFRFFA